MAAPVVMVWVLMVGLSGATTISGPYKILIEKFESCDDEGTREVVFGTKVYRTSDGKYMYNNPVYLGHPIDQHFKVYIELQAWGNGGYRPRFIQYTFKGCDELWKYFQDFYKRLMRSAGVSIDKCPIPSVTLNLISQLHPNYFFQIHRKVEYVNVTYDFGSGEEGNYTTKDLDINLQNVNNIPFLIYNKYRAVAVSYYKGSRVGCIRLYGEAVPK